MMGSNLLGTRIHLPDIKSNPRAREIGDGYREDLIEPRVLAASRLKLDSVQSSRARDQWPSRVSVDVRSVIHLYHGVGVHIKISQGIKRTKVGSHRENSALKWLAMTNRAHLLRSSHTITLGA